MLQSRQHQYSIWVVTQLLKVTSINALPHLPSHCVKAPIPYGCKDKRVPQIISAMLKAGDMGQCEVNKYMPE